MPEVSREHAQRDHSLLRVRFFPAARVIHLERAELVWNRPMVVSFLDLLSLIFSQLREQHIRQQQATRGSIIETKMEDKPTAYRYLKNCDYDYYYEITMKVLNKYYL